MMDEIEKWEILKAKLLSDRDKYNQHTELPRQEKLFKVRILLESLGIKMNLNSCGCCNGVEMYFEHEGKVLYRDGSAEMDMTEEMKGFPE